MPTQLFLCNRRNDVQSASKTRLKAAIVGGAQLFSFQTAGDRLDVGRRNTEAVKAQLKKLGIKIVAEDTGGNAGRTVVLDAQTGRVYVKSVGNETVLTELAA